jgi:hypothetical protein
MVTLLDDKRIKHPPFAPPFLKSGKLIIESAIVSFARTPNGGLVVPPGATTTQSRDLIVALSFPRSARSATPHFSSYPQAGRLITPSFPASGGDRIKPGARCDTLELANTCSQCSWNTSQFQYV